MFPLAGSNETETPFEKCHRETNKWPQLSRPGAEPERSDKTLHGQTEVPRWRF
jgi:hypothetical protein